MYNEDDAVAKLDGYVVSVVGGGSLIGERTLVRIDKVGRSAASASLVNPPENGGSRKPASSEDDSDGESRPRRRGRRGGRRRKKAPATD